MENEISPYEIFSFYELMYKLDVGDLALSLAGLESLRRAVENTDRISPGEVVPDTVVTTIKEMLKRLQKHQDKLQLDPSLKRQIENFSTKLENGKAGDLRSNAVDKIIESLMSGVLTNLRARFFLFVPSDKAKHYDNVDLFRISPLVFLEAAEDMINAGNCYAANLPTACIFHLMRVSEYGLRALARKLKVSLRDNGKKCPIEHATWNKVLDAINNKIKKARSRPTGVRKNNELRFYSDAASHCMHIRDLWRNEVSHTRTSFNEHEAFAAMNRISDFMQLLAEQLYTDAERQKIVVSNFPNDSAAMLRRIEQELKG